MGGEKNLVCILDHISTEMSCLEKYSQVLICKNNALIADTKIHSTTNALFSKIMLERMTFILNNFWQFGIVFSLCLPRRENQNESEENQS